ncbi:MAG: NADPH-dependent assimilatory sulfite reductase hemoprotein subunit [Planctomycetes bacterium]|nr:NADPH-dependent assimilatory sulfite reductase hemoprotein subunit [Planctomycetota bacterium]
MGNVEEVKKNSQGLRGTIAETLARKDACFNDTDQHVIKFHGLYQEDDRDERMARIKAKEEPAYILMVRCKLPGGKLSAAQYLAMDQICGDLGNGSLRVTTRQDFQFHGVLLGNVKELIQKIYAAEVTTFGGCGDVERNVVATPAPFAEPMYREIQEAAQQLSAATLPKTRAYFDVWLDGEKLKREDEPDPLYKDVYLPRKFKSAILAGPRNDIDAYAHDLTFVAHAPTGTVEGYTVLAGGGFGMDHGKKATYPFLAVPLYYVGKEHVVDVAKAVIATFRDFGDRENRKHARLKYQIVERGVQWLIDETKSRLPGVKFEKPKSLKLGSTEDWLGWHEQGDGKLFLGVKIESGRIKDFDGGPSIRTALRTLVERFKCEVRLTANQNVIFCHLNPADRGEIDAHLQKHGILPAADYTRPHRMGIACTALPTCKLALSESERVFPDLMNRIDAVLKDLGLQDESILFRMTGCPNGCARPYNADFAFVGRGIGKYAVYIGGSHRGDRMAGLAMKTCDLEEIPGAVRPYLESFKAQRTPGETFTDWWGRTQPAGPAPHPDQFHVELEARKARLAGTKASAPE